MSKITLKERHANHVIAGGIIKRNRINRHLTGKRLAQLADLNPGYFSKIETGNSGYAPKEKQIVKIGKILQMDQDEVDQILMLYGKVPSEYADLFAQYYKKMPSLLARIGNDPSFAEKLFSTTRALDSV